MCCKNIHAADVVKCNDVNCKSHDHLNQIDTLYSQLCSVLKQASDDSIPTSRIHTHHNYIVPGFNEFAKNLHSEARGDYLLWKASGKPRSNKLLRTFHYCSSDVKLELFKSYCTSFYCCYLWTAYKKSTFDRLRVAFNNAYRRVLSQPWRCSASAMYANFGIDNFEITIRKSTYGFIQRLAKSTNLLIMTIEKSWVVRIDIWNFWQKNFIHCFNKMNFR